MELIAADGLVLSSLTEADAPALLGILDADRPAFDPWLRWSGEIRDLDGARRFIVAATTREGAGDGFHLGLRRQGALIGGVVCWHCHPTHRNAELGYWLLPAARGGGIVSGAMRLVMARMFAEGVHRIELQCAVHNVPSRRVAERLGFRFEGVRRGSHRIGGRFVDHALYGLLAGEQEGGPRSEGGAS